MALYSMEQLLGKDEAELKKIAEELNSPNKDSNDKQTLIYDILDTQAEQKAYSETSSEKKELQDEKKKKGNVKSKKKTVSKSKVKEEEKEEDTQSEKKKRGRPAKTPAKSSKSKKVNEEEPANDIIPETAIAKENSKKEDLRKKGNQLEKEKNKKNAVPEFIAEQMKEKETHDETAVDDIVDLNEIKDQLTDLFPKKKEDLPLEKESIDAEEAVAEKEENKDKKVAADIQPESDFIILKDVPVIYNDSIYDNELDIEPIITDKLGKIDETLFSEKQQSSNAVDDENRENINLIDNFLDGGGVLEIMSEGFGFLRSSDYNYLTSPDDIYISSNQIKQYCLKQGDVVEGKVRMPKDNERFFAINKIERINGVTPEIVRDRVAFEHLTPLFPDEKFNLCSGKNDPIDCRIVDLCTPIGKGQRALIVAQPKTGKTWLMKNIANAISKNHPETYLIMLLIDERPEEVTDMARTVNAEVIASTFDEPASHHVKIANIVLDKAKRMVECGHDVVIFLDSITRLARAYNTVSPASGKVLTGGVDANSLQHPKRFFGAARNIENGGSLTIIATALIDTGSKMDEVIFEEFKGTGNMELQLDRNLSNKRLFPSINIVASSTRRDDLLHDELTQNRMWLLRNIISGMNPVEAMTEMLKRIKNTINNEEFLMSLNS